MHNRAGTRRWTARARQGSLGFSMEREFRLLEKLIEEDRAAVQEFFLRLGQTIPPWLVLGFLQIVASEARCHDFILTLNASLCVDPNGNGPLWG